MFIRINLENKREAIVQQDQIVSLTKTDERDTSIVKVMYGASDSYEIIDKFRISDTEYERLATLLLGN